MTVAPEKMVTQETMKVVAADHLHRKTLSKRPEWKWSNYSSQLDSRCIKSQVGQ